MVAERKILAAFCLFLLSASKALAGDAVPSFDCSRAKASDEQQICRDARLAELDQAIALAFKQALEVYPKKLFAGVPGSAGLTPSVGLTKEVQKGLRDATRDRLDDRHACGASPICILDVQILTLTNLEEAGANVPIPPWVNEYRFKYAKQHPDLIGEKLPNALGHCTRTKIASITGRFGETLKWPPEKDEIINGTAVRYANGAYQVSYQYEEAVARSHIGDEVLICLSTIPRHCPPGDDRGREYSTTGIETNLSWIMPDLQHMCGGP